ncbi:nuclear transport factor 2 family protein [SAR202 cluster bacterium AD-804-J14_MRT_500m]|nr:nuclear transport factor 2 family protein [SAR202 cluster bacterium AD-804-J14_MRT_500m]
MKREDLENWIQTQTDIRDIENLKGRYAAFCDDGYNPDGIASLFTSDGVWEAPWQGRFEGREEIKSFFQRVSGTITFSIHGVVNPVINVNGNSADGRWYLFQPCIINGEAYWVSGKYLDEYSKINGEWFFKSLKVSSFFRAPFASGWNCKPLG